MASERSPFITKVLLPKRPAGTLTRPRLLDFLHRAIDRRLILVSAPAGYGKTTLLVDFAHDLRLPVCWYTVDAADRDPQVFLQYLVAAIRQRFPAFGPRTQALLDQGAAGAQELDAVAGTLVSEIYDDIAEFFVLILDDFHTVDGSEAVQGVLNRLLQHLPDNCHILLATRTLPRLDMIRLVAQGHVAGLGLSDLRFTAGEIRDYLARQHDVVVPESRADALAAESEGWITGIILSSQTLWRGLFESLARAKGTGSPLFDYLAREVYAQQDAAVRRFLAESSVLARISPPRCDALLGTGDAAERLAQIEEANLFLTRLDDPEPWYKYHDLFRDFLQATLRREAPARYTRLHARAGDLAEADGDTGSALGHYLQAERPERAAAAVERVAAPLLGQGRWPTILGWLEQLPAALLDDRPRLLLVQAECWQQQGALDDALPVLARARALFRERADALGEAQALVREAAIQRLRGRYAEARALCERALALAPPAQPETAAAAYSELGAAAGSLGDLAGAVAALDQARRLSQPLEDRTTLALLHQRLGQVHTLRGDLTEAAYHYEEALRFQERLGHPAGKANALNALGVVYHLRGEYGPALSALERAVTEAEPAHADRFAAYAWASIADVRRDLGQIPEATAAYKQSLAIAERLDESFLHAYCLDGLGTLRRLGGDLLAAERLCRAALRRAEQGEAPYELGLFRTSYGILCYEQGQYPTAIQQLAMAARSLEHVGARRELARTHLHLAEAHWRNGDRAAAVAALVTLAAAVERLGYDAFLIPEAQRMAPLLRSAARQPQLAAFCRQLLKRGQALQETGVLPAPITAPPPAAGALVVRALGPGQVLRDGQPLSTADWGTETARALFFYLLAHPEGARKEEAAVALWPDLPARRVNSSFHSAAYRLRRAVGSDCLVLRDGRYTLALESDAQIDVVGFERWLARAARWRAGSAEWVQALEAAVALYTGPYFTDGTADWCDEPRARLETGYLTALNQLVDHYAGRGDYPRVVALCERMLAHDPYDETVHYALMLAYLHQGEATRAARHYRRYQRQLAQEIDAQPTARLTALYHRARQAAASLSPRQPA